MAILLFKLRHVPDDEAEDIRGLLAAHAIDYYETSAGLFQISMPGIWLTDENQLPQARALIDDYQERRYLSAREQYETLRSNGELQTVFGRFRENPLRFIVYFFTILLVLYLSLHFFLGISE